MVVIFCNVILMTMDYYKIEEDDEFYAKYTRAMVTFSYIYYAEAVLKLTGLGSTNYFNDGWCSRPPRLM